MLRFLIGFIIFYVGLVGILVLKQRSFMYFPMTKARPDISKAPYMQWVEVTTRDGVELRAWFYPPKKGKPTLLLFHGNGHNIESRLSKIIPYINKNYGVLLAEYRGYGGNPGNPSEEGFYNDARAYIEWLEKEQGIKDDSLILYGESVGSGVAVQMATEYEIQALVLEVPFSSMLDVARMRYFFVPYLSVLLKDKYMSHEKIGSINIPVLIGIAGRDEVVTSALGKKLFDAANQPKTLKLYEEAGHNNMYYYGFENDVMEFLDALSNNLPAEQSE